MENKTAMQVLYDWVDTELKLLGYEHKDILDKITPLRDNEEREQIEEAYVSGNREEYYDGIETTCSLYYTTKYITNGIK